MSFLRRASAALLTSALLLTLAATGVARAGTSPAPRRGSVLAERPVRGAVAADTGVVSDRIIIGLVPKRVARMRTAARADALGTRIETDTATSRFMVVTVPAGRDAHAVEASLAAQPDARYVEFDDRVQATYVPSDPLYPQQWGLPDIGAPAAWDVTKGSPSVIVAVVDSGVDYTHPDLAGQVLASQGHDFVNHDADAMDDYGHGTHVSGIIGMVPDNGIGGSGLAPSCKILPVKVLDRLGSGDDSDVAAGIIYAVDHGASVVNLSLGGPDENQTLDDACSYAAAHDVAVVAAAGNTTTYETAVYPAASPGVVAVAATASNDLASPVSSWGPYVDLAAPGQEITSTVMGGGYQSWTGTSMATPFVSAAIALVRSHFGDSAAQAIGKVEQSATDLGVPGRDDHFGYGLLNVSSALASMPSTNTPPVAYPGLVTTAEDHSAGVTLAGSDADGDPLSFRVTSGPSHGSLSGTPPNLTYTPAPDFNGADGFSFVANDGTADSLPAVVTITVTPVNDAPTAVDWSGTAAEDTTLVVAAPGLLAGAADVDGDSLTATITVGPLHGALAAATDGSFAYRPAPGWSGADSFAFKAWDGHSYSTARTASVVVHAHDVTTYPVGGADRYETAVLASRHAFPAGSPTVLIATGAAFPDALGAAALAGAWDAPIVLVPPRGTLPASVAGEITRLGAGRMIVLGGTGAVPDAMASQVRARLVGARTMTRYGGADRYATACLAASAAKARWVATGRTFPTSAFVVSGVEYRDAMLAAPIAFRTGRPVLLCTPTGVPAGTSAEIRALGVNNVTVVGPASVASSGVMNALRGVTGVVTVSRVGDSADGGVEGVQVAEMATTSFGMTWDGLAIATSDTFPDALAAGPMQGRAGSVVLLTPTASLSPAVASALTTHKSAVSTVSYLGGTAAVSQTVRDAVVAALK